MALEQVNLRRINRSTYCAEWLSAGSTSLPDFPTDPEFQRFCCSVRCIRANPVFPVWFTDPPRQRFVSYDDPDATPITFTELAGIDHLLTQKLKPPAPGKSTAPLQLIVEHCARCGRRVVKYGCKRLLQHIVDKDEAWFEIVEVSGGDWSHCQYDMKKVCRCRDAT